MAQIPYERVKGIFIESVFYRGELPGQTPQDLITSANFASQAKMALNILYSKPIGKELLETISKFYDRGQNGGVLIEWGLNASAAAVDNLAEGTIALLRQGGGRGTTANAFRKAVRGQGGCKGARALWNPSNVRGDGVVRPSYIPLAHELIHCLHYLAGDCARPITALDNIAADSGLAEEEARTVGIGPYTYPYHSDYFCENAIRYAFKELLRNEYLPGNDLSFVKRSRN